MNRAFLYSPTDAVIVPDSSTSRNIREAVDCAYDRTVIVSTPAMTGAGAIIGGKVITSLLLVAKFREVSIRMRQGKKMSAYVHRFDYDRNLAELLPFSLGSPGRNEMATTKEPRVGTGGGIGEPLIFVDVGNGVPSAKVAGMMYNSDLAEPFKNKWKLSSAGPRGIMGSGVWNTVGKFIGISL